MIAKLHPHVFAVLLAMAASHAAAQAPLDSTRVEQVVAAGWSAAREHRHAEAADLFRRAIELDPARRRDLLLELAVRLTHSGRAAEALPLYREVLTWQLSPEEERRARGQFALSLSWTEHLPEALSEYRALLAADPDDLDARLGVARILGWTRRPEEARAGYERVLAADSGNLDALRGLARYFMWQGRHREAQRRIRGVLRDHPRDVEAKFILAESQGWMGRTDQAIAGLSAIVIQHPDFEPARRLLARFQLRQRPDTRLDLQAVSQSDNLRVSTLTASQSVSLNHGLTTLELRYQRSVWEPGSRPDVRIVVDRPGLAVRHRFNDWSELTASGHLDATDPREGEGHLRPTYETRLALMPSDSWRFDLQGTRSTFEDALSLIPAVTITWFGGGVDVTPDPDWRGSVRANWGTVSDGNERTWAQAEVERRLRVQPVVLLGANYTTFSFAEQSGNGYFSPERYDAGIGFVRVHGHVRERFYWGGEGTYGLESTGIGGRRRLWGAGMYATCGASRHFELQARLHTVSSQRFFVTAIDPGGQYRRGTAGLAVRYIW